jgi:hypothetical protein
LKKLFKNFYIFFFFIYMSKLQGHNPLKQSHETLLKKINFKML